MNKVTKKDLEALALGSAVLGSGGGGDPAYDLLMAQHAFDQYGEVDLITLEELQENDLIVPFDFMGAPLIATEQLPSGQEFLILASLIQKTLGKSIRALVTGEIGGGNAFTSLTAACRLGLPVIDGDLIGRAFPQLHMCLPALMGISPSPAFLVDCKGNYVTVCAKSGLELENISRHVAIAMGSHCALASFLMNGNEAKKGVVPGSISRACTIGATILEARAQSVCPVDAVLRECKGVRLAQGIIADINHVIKGGFLQGEVCVHQTQGDHTVIVYQNEYLLAKQNQKILATTPDILALLESDSGTPITSESLKYGLRVDLIALSAPDVWTTPEALELVGPQFFGYETTYRSL